MAVEVPHEKSHTEHVKEWLEAAKVPILLWGLNQDKLLVNTSFGLPVRTLINSQPSLIQKNESLALKNFQQFLEPATNVS